MCACAHGDLYAVCGCGFAEQLIELHRGQGKDIYWRDCYICPTEDEYMIMVKQSKSCDQHVILCGHVTSV